MIDTPPEPLPAQEQVIEQKLRDCGLKADGITVKYENELQSIEVVITPEAGAAPEHFPCIHEAVFPEIVWFSDQTMFVQYTNFEAEMVRPQVLAELEASLRKSGLWENFPQRPNFETTADYSAALEAHAGFVPGTALQVAGADQLTLIPPDSDQGYAEFAERISKLLAVLGYASVTGQISFGFIGNEKYRE